MMNSPYKIKSFVIQKHIYILILKSLNFIMFRNKELFLTRRGKSIMDVEMEKRKFLNLCGKRDQALLSGEKRMTDRKSVV